MTDDFVQVTWNEQLEDDCRQIVRLAVREDLDRQCDWTTVSLVSADATAAAFVVVREPGVIAGLRVAELALDEMQTNVVMQFLHADGDLVTAGTPVARLDGSARDLLSSERILLNLIGRMSGIASLTRQYVECVAETKARIYDTRKTTPGWRRLEKYAVRAGGGVNHRTGLFDAVMIKDNHLALSAQRGLTPSEAVRQTREFLNSALETKSSTPLIVEVEVDTVEQLQEVLDAKPDLVLLDVFFPDGNGIDLMWKIRQSYKNTDVIFITAAKEVETLQDAIRGGAFDFVLKPMTFSRFQSTLGRFLEHRNKLKGITSLDQSEVDQIIHPAHDAPQTDGRMPKSIDPLTLEKIEDEVKKIDCFGDNAEVM